MDTRSEIKEEITFRKNITGIYSNNVLSNGITEDKLLFVRDRKVQLSTISAPVTVFDVASYILEKLGSCTTMKLHKLLYYCQVWSLVWDERPLFKERIEAWANGPVVRDLFPFHRGVYEVNASNFVIGNPRLLNETQRETVDGVLIFYGDKSSQWLVNLTHSEQPWIDARQGLEPMERGASEIKWCAMVDYYSSL